MPYSEPVLKSLANWNKKENIDVTGTWILFFFHVHVATMHSRSLCGDHLWQQYNSQVKNTLVYGAIKVNNYRFLWEHKMKPVWETDLEFTG